MTLLALAVLAETEEHLNPTFLPPIAFAAIAAAIFLTLALVTWSYRDVANRHSDKTSDSAGQDGHH